MGEKANFASVTTEPCTCDYLQREAAEPSSPIQFDKRHGEYKFANRTGNGTSIIFHCPWCGGVAPKSQRAREFAVLTWDEIRRLEELTEPIHTPEDAIVRFGTPQHEQPRGLTVQTPGTDTEPARAESFRTLMFTGLSETADVTLVDQGPHGIKWQYSPKHIGHPEGEE